MSQLAVGIDRIRGAAEILRGVANRTPVITSRTMNALTGAELFFKAENFQRTGSFKFRGAYHALSRLGPDERRRGVLTYSSGNHGQAVGLAGRLLGVPAVVVMPADAPRVKIEATEGYGAEVVLYDRQRETREAIGGRIAADRGLTSVPPFDHPDVIAGQGTAALELIDEVGPLDALFVCVGGGGLISGCALAAADASPGCRVIGAEPALADDAARSFRTGTLQRNENPPTIADGARTTCLGNLTFPIIQRHVADFVTVEEAEIVAAMKLAWERLKMIVEPTGALSTAAALKSPIRGQRVGIIVSGGNADVVAVAKMFA